MFNQKKLYVGGCSFLENPNILLNTELSDHFGPDPIVINAAAGGSNNDAIFRKAYFSLLRNDFDFVLIGWTQVWRISKVMDVFKEDTAYLKALTDESYSSILNTTQYYTAIIGNDKNYNRFSHLEPEGTDNCIMYTIILHRLMKERGIPHLFISMGNVFNSTLGARPGWLEFMDTKNYFGSGELKDKMAVCMTDEFHNEHKNMFGENYHDSTYTHPLSLIRDNANHLTDRGGRMLAKQILEYIKENGIA